MLENPAKYEQILLKENEVDPWLNFVDYPLESHVNDQKLKNVDYWYRFFNDGVNKKNDHE